MEEKTHTTTDQESDLGADVHWNLGDLYGGTTDPRIGETLAACQSRAEQFQADYKGKIDSLALTAEILGAALREYEDIQQQAAKPGSFAALLFAADSADPARGAFLQQMREAGTRLALPLLFFDLELAALPDGVLGPLRDSPHVEGYRHYLGTVRASRDHVLSEVEERLMEELANTGGRAFDRLFEETTSSAVFELDGETLTQAQVIARTMSGDREIRRRAAAAFTQGLGKHSAVVTFLFNTLMQDKSVKDRLRRFETPQAARHLENELDEATVSLVVDTVVRNYPLVARYYDVKRQILGLDALTHFDRYAPLFEAEETISYPHAQQTVLDAFRAFSPVLRDRAAEFFDKSWIDAPATKGKDGGAFCAYVTPDTHPYILTNYLGRMKDVMTLAHELGHGVHASLSRSQTLLNFQGTLPLAELASTFAEMLVFEKVAASASAGDKLALYAEKIEGAFATIPRQTAMYRFEQAIHTHRRTQGELTTEQFGDYWQREIQAMFGDSVALGDEHRLWWSYIGHFVGAPFYVYAYSFGELLVFSLFQQWKKEGAPFAARYLDMLAAGGSLTPHALMSRVGVALDDPAFWQGGFDVLGALVGEFESLWRDYQKAG
jgi:oligoendopeptidase F